MVRLQKKPSIVAGVQWTGYNIMEIYEFIGHRQKYPKTQEEYTTFLETQEKNRIEGLRLPEIAHPDMVLCINDWVVIHDDGSYGFCSKYIIENEYNVVEDDE